MARSRTWNLRLNVDEFNVAYAALDSPQERADWLTGFYKALNRATLSGGSQAMSAGFEFAQQMVDEAEAFREKAAVAGSKGGYSKRGSHPTATLHRTP